VNLLIEPVWVLGVYLLKEVSFSKKLNVSLIVPFMGYKALWYDFFH
jgi:hypothetical protein